MPGTKERKRDDGKRKNTKRQKSTQDVMARKTGNAEARAKTKGDAPRAMKSGRQTTR